MKRFVQHAWQACAVIACASLASACSPSSEGNESADVASMMVEAVTPQRLTWPAQLSASGALKPWQEAIVSAETGPLRIASLQADVGSQVKRGAVLATLARETVLADQARLRALVAEAHANLAKANSDVERARQVEASGALSAQQIQQYRVAQQTSMATLASARAQLRSVETQLGQTNILAVDDGIISSRSALLGKVVTAGEEMFRIVRQGRIEWQAELDAKQLARVRAGQAAQVTLPGGEVVSGSVRLVSPTLDGNTSRGIAFVRLPAGSLARAGMYGNGVIDTDASEVLTVPDSAVVLRDGRSFVYLLNKDKRVKQQQVVAGQRRDGRIAITGIPDNARVVTTGGAFLSDGALVLVSDAEGARK